MENMMRQALSTALTTCGYDFHPYFNNIILLQEHRSYGGEKDEGFIQLELG
jgi:hypothetical protein